MRAEDLTPLFKPATEEVGFHSGKIINWNVLDGTNTVEVAGSNMVNLPMLNLGDVIAYDPGDIVGILRFSNTYFILGRIVSAGSPLYASAATATLPVSNSVAAAAVTTTETTVVTSALLVPTWANEADVFVVSTMTASNNGASPDYFGVRTVVDGAPGGTQNFSYVQVGQYMSVTSAVARTVTGLTETLTINTRVQTAAVNFTTPASIVSHDGLVVFRSTA